MKVFIELLQRGSSWNETRLPYIVVLIMDRSKVQRSDDRLFLWRGSGDQSPRFCGRIVEMKTNLRVTMVMRDSLSDIVSLCYDGRFRSKRRPRYVSCCLSSISGRYLFA